jgi:hypothetical protein
VVADDLKEFDDFLELDRVAAPEDPSGPRLMGKLRIATEGPWANSLYNLF